MAFDSDGDEKIPEPVRKIGLKKANVVKQQSSSEIKNNFEKKADDKFSKIEDYKQQMWDLSVKYKSIIQSKLLPENKGPISLNVEKEILDKLVQLATDMNEDETQPESIGSTALCMLLMKCMLLQRDEINQLYFRVEQLEKK